MKKLGEYTDITVGQILARVTEVGNSEGKKVKVLMPKAISEGAIDDAGVEEIVLVKEVNPDKYTKFGDIVVKLNTPYEAAIIDKCHAGMIVPSFCAVIRVKSGIDTNYMCALVNSSIVREQMRAKMAGVSRSLMKITDLRGIEIAEIDPTEMEKLGREYALSGQKRMLLRKLAEVERQIMDARIVNSITGDPDNE